MSTITLIGPGAVGLTVGAALIDNGHAVTFVGREGFDRLTVKTEDGTFRQHKVTVVTESAPPADWVFLCVKAHQVAAAAALLNSAVAAGSRVAVLQNGVEHRERVTPFLAAAAIVPVMVDVPAGRLGRGEVLWRGRALLNVQDDGDGRDFRALFDDSFVAVSTVDDLKTRMWRKLCVNAPGGAILCLTGKTMQVFHEPGIADLARALLGECVAVGRAEGARLDDAVIDEQMASFLAAAPDEGNSMFDDWRAGRETEWDARNGVLVRKGARHGVATPVSAVLVPLLAAQKP